LIISTFNYMLAYAISTARSGWEAVMQDSAKRSPAGPREAAAYVAELTGDLARIARQHRLDALGYLLDMARLEAQQVAGAADDLNLS
jgi:hypothetical protein